MPGLYRQVGIFSDVLEARLAQHLHRQRTAFRTCRDFPAAIDGWRIHSCSRETPSSWRRSISRLDRIELRRRTRVTRARIAAPEASAPPTNRRRVKVFMGRAENPRRSQRTSGSAVRLRYFWHEGQ